MPSSNPYFDTLTDEQLQAYIRGPRVNEYSPAGVAPFTWNQLVTELSRRRQIQRGGVEHGLTPEEVQRAIRNNDWSGGPPPTQYTMEDTPGIGNLSSVRPPPVPNQSAFMSPEAETPYAPATPLPPTEQLPVGEQFGPPAPSAARNPAGGARQGSRGNGGGASNGQPLPVPPVPPGNEMFGPDASLAPTRDPAMSARDQNKWLAVLQAGLGMLAADGPNAAANIGKGGMAGVTAFQDWEKTRKSEEARDRQLDIMDKYREGQIEVARQNADTRLLELGNQLQIARIRAANAEGTSARREAELSLREARLAFDRERSEAQLRQRENERDPAVRAQQQWTAQRAQMIERAMAMKDEMGRPMFATPEALNRYVDGVVGPQPGAVPRAVRDQLSQGYAAFMNGSLPADKWNEMLTGFRRSFNVDPNIYLRD